MFQLGEFQLGVVAFLDHAILEKYGFRLRAQRSDRPGHWFLCVAAAGDNCSMIMLTSQRWGRTHVPNDVKYGHPSFIENNTFVGALDTMLTGRIRDLQVATANDRSTEHDRNGVDTDWVLKHFSQAVAASTWSLPAIQWQGRSRTICPMDLRPATR
jgi:hypothetical protein